MEFLISQFARSLSGAENLEQLTRPILELLQRITGLESTYLTVIDESKGIQTILFSDNSGSINLPEGMEVPWADTLCKRAMDERRFFTDDVEKIWGDSEAARELGLKTYLSVPVNNLDGSIYGTLCGASSHSSTVDPEILDVLELCSELIAYQIARDAVARDSVRRARRAEKKLESLSLIAEIGELCFRSYTLDSALIDAAGLLEKSGEWVRAVPFVQTAQGVDVLVDGGDAWLGRIREVVALIPLTDSLNGSAHPDPFISAYEVEILESLQSEAGLSSGASAALVSVETGARRVAGIFLIQEKALTEPENNRQVIISCSNYLSLLADRLEYLTQLERANQELVVYALHDPLTGLANRRYLVEELARMLVAAERNGSCVYVAFIDLDGFKYINDQHGHDAGDHLLKGIATRLREATRGGDLVSRYGGDEFVVLSSAGAEEESSGLEAFLDRLRSVTTGQFILPELTLDYGGASVGGVASQPGERDPDKLLARADEAMYVIKKARKQS
ncbi:sensor domain-containing diguanylate cyclase [uncultured Marinobacter sp.]|uniref:sensor domain-containing diguanylate cyclase n=1 Tax=uncultured Marinobacter sp. TaxID=187379 RepID=UPI00262C0FA0|nr:sensor domain-containing diguanylate cyclase [uncultured Marinobacter sp.]